MATLPNATTTVQETSSALAQGTDIVTVLACVANSADFVPRLMSSTQNILAQYGYAAGVDYCAMHFAETGKPVLFVGLPIATQGQIGAVNNTGNTGTCTVTVTAGANGPMDAVRGQVKVVSGTNVGTDQIVLSLSLDDGDSWQTVRLGQNTSYTIPYVGLALNFTSGTLNAGDIALTFRTTGPMWGSTAMASAQAALAAIQQGSRSWLVVDEVPNATFAGYVLTAVNGYETANERYVYARVQTNGRNVAAKSQLVYSMTGAPSITFASTGHTITRATGSFIADGFAVGQVVKVAGSTANNGVIGALTAVSATVLTFASGITTEGPDATGVSITASEAITFAASGETVTRSAGSWLADGFSVGDSVTFAGTTSNNFTGTVSALTATVMTLTSGVTNEGPDMGSAVSCVKQITTGAYVAAQAVAYASIAAASRIDLGIERGRKVSPITGWNLRRPVQWAASLREYQHDVQIACYRKSDGPLDGWSLFNASNQKVEFDERSDGGATEALFTAFRTYANGPSGAFIALSLTRDNDGALLSRTQNRAVADVAQAIIQATTENFIGQVLQLNADGTGTTQSLGLLEDKVNAQLQLNLLSQDLPEGPRASSAVWSASRTANLAQPGALLPGTCSLVINGTLEQIATTIAAS